MYLYDKDASAGMDALYEQHAGAIFDYLRHRTPTRQDAEDILLDVFTAAMEDRKFAHLAEREQISWLWRVARNKVVDAFRRLRVRQCLTLEQISEMIDDDHLLDPERAALQLDYVAQVQQLMTHLSPLQQEIIQLRFGYELRCPEIAQILGKREQAIYTALSRALNLLRSVHTRQ